MLRLYYLGVAMLYLATLSVADAIGNPPESKKRPNVLFILADDLGWRDLSNEGSTFYESPHICLLYTSPSPRDQRGSRMPSSA